MPFSSGNIFARRFHQSRFGWNGGFGNLYGYNWGMKPDFRPRYPIGRYGGYPYGRRC